jgi:hypothetical protein
MNSPTHAPWTASASGTPEQLSENFTPNQLLA